MDLLGERGLVTPTRFEEPSNETAAARHYSGILVVARPGELERCAEQVAALAGVEVHYAYPDSGRLIAVQETATVEQQERGLRVIQGLSSVRMAALVEHRIDGGESRESGGSA